MFIALQTEVMERFTSTKAHFRASRSFRGDADQTARGLVFVQIYAVWEYTVNEVVRVSTSEICQMGKPMKSFRPSLQTLLLHSMLRSYRDTGPDTEWEKAIKLLEAARSDTVPPIIHAMPVNGTHYREPQIALLFRVFGVKRKTTSSPRHVQRILEVVNNRNAIAHGREVPAVVGARYSRAEITRRILQMERMCLRLIAVFEQHLQHVQRFCDQP